MKIPNWSNWLRQMVCAWSVGVFNLWLVAGPDNGGPSAAPEAAKATAGAQQPDSVGAAQTVPAGASQSATVKLSATVEGVVQMGDAGVSKEVIKAYVEHASAVPALTPAEIIALKRHTIPDEITTALLKRAEELRAPVRPAERAKPGTVVPQENPRYVSLDPEGYDFFRYHYLYPRALASANERLWRSSPTPAFGWGGPPLLRPYPASRFGYPP